MAVPAVNITIEQGTDFENVYTVTNPDGTPLDLTGYTSSAKIKKFPSSTTSSSFSVGIVTSAGQVVVSMAHTVTNALSPGRYYYDVIITSGSTGKISRIIEGMALITPSVST
jgi:hypothetical protein